MRSTILAAFLALATLTATPAAAEDATVAGTNDSATAPASSEQLDDPLPTGTDTLPMSGPDLINSDDQHGVYFRWYRPSDSVSGTSWLGPGRYAVSTVHVNHFHVRSGQRIFLEYVSQSDGKRYTATVTGPRTVFMERKASVRILNGAFV